MNILYFCQTHFSANLNITILTLKLRSLKTIVTFHITLMGGIQEGSVVYRYLNFA